MGIWVRAKGWRSSALALVAGSVGGLVFGGAMVLLDEFS
jgi:hypothetical protein